MAVHVDVDPDAAPGQTPVTPQAPAAPATAPSTFELYKLAVEMADRVSARRTSANNFFVALHGLLATVIGLIGFANASTAGAATPTLITGVAGIVLCVAWWLGLRSYRDLNAAKFKVITSLEASFPVHLFGDEWKYLKDDQVRSWRGRYSEQGTVERIVPVVFGGLYAFAILRTLCS